MSDTKGKKRTFTLSLPQNEADAILKAAERLNISFTLLFRMWVRSALMDDPIKCPEEV